MENVSPHERSVQKNYSAPVVINTKLAKRRAVPLALWERGNGGEGTIMTGFIIRGGFFAMIVRLKLLINQCIAVNFRRGVRVIFGMRAYWLICAAHSV